RRKRKRSHHHFQLYIRGLHLPRKTRDPVDGPYRSSNSATGIQQSIATTPGATYALTFFIGSAYNPGGPLGIASTVRVRINGTLIASFTFNAMPGSTAQQWRKSSTEFQATSSTTFLSFINADPPGVTDNGLDAVAVTL